MGIGPKRAPWTEGLELVFLVGCPRSGTTWVQALLASHPAVYTGPETQFFATFNAVDREFNREKDRMNGLSAYWDTPTFYASMAGQFWGLVSALPAPVSRPQYFLEKSPNDTEHADFILKTFPKAHFIHLVRDGRAVISSLLRASLGWAAGWAPASVELAAKYWLYHTSLGRDIRRKVSDSDQYTEVKYEDFRERPREHLSELYRWLGLAVDDALVESALRANSLENVKKNGQVFSSIPVINGSKVAGKEETYPEGFVGPAPARVTEVPLTGLQLAGGKGHRPLPARTRLRPRARTRIDLATAPHPGGNFPGQGCPLNQGAPLVEAPSPT